MSEFWMPVPGWEGYYAVSDLARVKSLPRDVPRSGSTMRIRHRILRPGIAKSGYPLVVLRGEGKSFSRTVHSLVADAFLFKPNEKCEVDHLNRDRTDARLSNLRWATRSENIANSEGRKRASRFKGVIPHGSKWIAQIGKTRIGIFQSDEDAARAYDSALHDKFGPFALTNFPINTAFQ